MAPQDIIVELRKQPFQPLCIHLTDGTTYEIRHPELAMVFQSKMIVAIPGPEQPEPAQQYDVISLGHIMRLTPLASATPPQNN